MRHAAGYPYNKDFNKEQETYIRARRDEIAQKNGMVPLKGRPVKKPSYQISTDPFSVKNYREINKIKQELTYPAFIDSAGGRNP